MSNHSSPEAKEQSSTFQEERRSVLASAVRPTHERVPSRCGILVLGVHRSGTSALTRVISLLGADLPKNLMPPVLDNNEAGFWESTDLQSLHDGILRSAGSYWHDWRRFNPQWFSSREAERYRGILAEYLARDFPDSSLFVIKDPRICRLVPLWLQVFEDRGITPMLVIMVRNPLEVAASLKARDGFLTSKSYLIWLRHVLEAERATRGLPRCIATYDELLGDWRQATSTIAERVGLSWPRQCAAAEVEIEEFLSARHRHHLKRAEELDARPEVVDWVKRAYSAMLMMMSSGDAASSLKTLDGVYAEFDKAATAFQAVVWAEQVAAREEGLGEGSSQVQRLSGELEARSVQVERLRREVESRSQALEHLGGELEASRLEAERLHAEVESRRQELQRASTALKERDERLRRLGDELESARATLGRRGKETDRLAKEVAVRDDKIQRIGGELASLTSDVRQRSAEAAHLSTVLGAEQRRVQQLSKELDIAREETLVFRNSLSWKFSAPLRLFGFLAGRFLTLLHWTLTLQLFARLEDLRQTKIVSDSGLFDETFYLAHNPDVARSGVDPLVHFMAHGAKEGRNPNPLFDVAYYLRMHPEAAKSRMNPLVHYLRGGRTRASNPNPLFDTEFYLSSNPDVAQSGVHPLLHFLTEGAKEGRDPHPLFDSSYYLSSYPEVAKAGTNPLADFLTNGAAEGRNPNAFFDVAYYSAKCTGVSATRTNPLVHYIEIGAAKGLDPSPWFDTQYYLAENPDVAESGEIPLVHYMRHECKTERKPNPDRKNIALIGHVAGKLIFGAERSLIELVAKIDRSKYGVFVVLPQRDDPYFAMLRPYVDDISVIKYRWWRKEHRQDDASIKAFMEFFTARKIDLVHVNSIMLQDAFVAARRLGIPSLVHVREIIAKDQHLCDIIGLSGPEIIERVSESADYVAANSDTTLAEFRKEGKSFRLYNTVDLAALDMKNEVDPDAIKVGLISSNLLKKGVGDFLRLAAAAYVRRPQLQFLLIGPENRLTKALVDAQRSGRLPSNFRLVGYQAESAAAHRQVNIVVNLSHFAESFGRTAAEAMAARRPVIAYEWGALPEIIRDGVDGFLVPLADWEAVLERLEYLCDRPNEIFRMGENGRQRACELFSREVNKEKLHEIYRRIFDETGPVPGLREVEALWKCGEVRNADRQEKDRSVRIGYFLWHFPVPSETFVLNELRYLVQAGHDVRVFCRQSPHPDFKPDFPIEWEHVGSVDDLRERLAANQRTVVHAHFAYPTVTEFVWPACERAKIPFTFIAHAQDIFRYENMGRNRVGEVARSDMCIRVLALGRFHRDFLVGEGVPPDKIVINPYGIDARFFVGAAERSTRCQSKRAVCALQRFVEKKGLKFLIQAGKLLEEHGISVNIYGDGPLRDEYEEAIRTGGVRNVILRGWVPGREGLLEVFREHDLLVCASLRAKNGDMDGIPTILVEAMAAGLPVLATPVASIPDLVQHEVTGLLCEPGDSASLADGILRFYELDPWEKDAIVENARSLAAREFAIEPRARTLLRLWQRVTFDVVLVSYNHLPELKEVVRRVFHYTTTPFNLIVVDNGSAPDVVEFLKDLERRHRNVKLRALGVNTYVGPGTNTGIEAGHSPYVVYLCAKEGFVTRYGWEQVMMNYLEEHPEVGVAGTLGYSPSYLTGRMYVENLPPFAEFRNREFAEENPDRIFRHVQGGLFILRRKMYEEIGGFSERVAHSHTDVEYSYYVESRGWKLGEIPGVLALYKATRPSLEARLDEKVVALHPATLDMTGLLDRVSESRCKFCNICKWSGQAFAASKEGPCCPACGSGPAERTLYKFLAGSVLTYRRLKALYVNAHPAMLDLWRGMFEGREASLEEVKALAEEAGSAGVDPRMDVVLLNGVSFQSGEDYGGALSLVSKLAAPGSTLLLRPGVQGEPTRNRLNFEQDSNGCGYGRLRQAIQGAGFQIREEVLYGSAVVQFDRVRLFYCTWEGAGAGGD